MQLVSREGELVVAGSALRGPRVGRLRVVAGGPGPGHGERVLLGLDRVLQLAGLVHKARRLQRDRAVLRFLCTQTSWVQIK